MIDEYQRYRYARRLMEERKYTSAAREFEEILRAAGGQEERHELGHGLSEVRLLLAQAYFHSAQLEKAEDAARALIERDPSDGYAVLLLARSLQRQGRRQEANPLLARANALGALD